MNAIIRRFIKAYEKGKRQAEMEQEVRVPKADNPMFYVSKGVPFGVDRKGYANLMCELAPLKDGWYFWSDEGDKVGPFEVETDAKRELFRYWAKL
jgi:hypothetical protein